MKKSYLAGMSKEGQNELALQYAIKERSHILYDIETPLVICEDTKVLRIYEKDQYVDEEFLDVVGEEDEVINEADAFDYSEDEDVEADENYSLDELRNRNFNHYEDSMEDEEVTSFNENQFREVRIVFADKIDNPQVYKKTKYTIDIFTSLPLEEIEQRLLECNSEDDIAEMQGE